MNRFLSLLLLGSLAATFGVVACAPDPSEEVASSTGSASFALTATAPDGAVYRLQNAVFELTGASSQTVSSTPDDATVELDVPVGAYLVNLRQGWQLTRTVDGVTTQVDASLISPNPQAAQVSNQQTTVVAFRFSVGGSVIEFGKGRLQIGLEIEDGSGGAGGVGGAGGAGGVGGAGGSGGVGGRVPSLISSNGYVQAGPWRGHAYTFGNAATTTPSCTATDACYSNAGPYLCVSGNHTTRLDSVFAVGFNLAQQSGGPRQTWPVSGNGVRLSVWNPSGAQLRVETTFQNEIYCATFSGSSATIPWSQFTRYCWEPGGPRLPMGAAIGSLDVSVPGNGQASTREICLVDAQLQ